MIGLNHYPMIENFPKPGSDKDPLRVFRSRIPEGESGPWKVKKFTVEVDLELLRLMRDRRGTPPGEYTALRRNGRVIMSDTDAEIQDLMEFFRKCKGRVLIHGLGLGVAVSAALSKPEVTHVDVVELSEDVINLVGKHIIDDRLVIHHGGCIEKKWTRGSRWDVVWHDIWDSICGDNLRQMKLLASKFRRRCSWQGFWAKEWIR